MWYRCLTVCSHSASSPLARLVSLTVQGKALRVPICPLARGAVLMEIKQKSSFCDWSPLWLPLQFLGKLVLGATVSRKQASDCFEWHCGPLPVYNRIERLEGWNAQLDSETSIVHLLPLLYRGPEGLHQFHDFLWTPCISLSGAFRKMMWCANLTCESISTEPSNSRLITFQSAKSSPASRLSHNDLQ